jgi:hypothetical protein
MLLDALGATWRVLDDGSVWVGGDAWPDSGWAHQTLASDEALARQLLAGEAATLRPGTTLDGRRVTTCSYVFTDQGVRVEAELGKADRLAAAVATMVRGEMRGVDYLAMYPGRILAQSADLLAVDIACDSKTVGGHRDIPLRIGIPGTKVKLTTGAGGARAMLGWENGDPQRPFVALFESGGLEEIRISATKVVLADGDRPVACVGDIVQVTLAIPAPVSATLTAVGQILQGQAKVLAP